VLRVGGIRVGVVGVGYWGSKHLRVLSGLPEVEQAIPIDPRLESMPALAHLLESGRAFLTLGEALPHLDAVVIATQPSLHVPLGLQALRAGKHTLVEKPLATTAAGGLELIAAAQESGAVLMVGHTFEHNPAVTVLRRLVQSNELGQLYYLDSSRLNLGLYQSDVNVVVDLAPHDISIANFVLGSEPTWVAAWGSRHVHPDHEDSAQLRIYYEEPDVDVTIHVSWLHPHKVRRTTAVGSLKMAVYDDMAADERIRVHDKSAMRSLGEGADWRVAYHYGDVVSPYVDVVDPLLVQDRQFVHCARTGDRPSTDGYDGLQVVRVLEAAKQSMEDGRRVMLKEIEGGELDVVDLRDPQREEGDHVAASSVL
jgi:predicted dehydrogenase